MEWHWTLLWKSNDHEPLMGSCRVPSVLQIWNYNLKTTKRQKNQIQNNQTTGRPLHNWDYISSNELCVGPIVVFTIIDYLSLGVLTSNQVAVKSNLHIAPTSNTIIPPTSHSAFQKWDTTRYIHIAPPLCMYYVTGWIYLVIDYHYYPMHWHAIPVSGFVSIVILDCVAKMETYARAAKHVAGYIIQIHPTPLLCICFPLLGCIDPQIRTSVKDISPLGSAPVTMAFAAKISCDGSCKHKHHHLVESLMHH